MSEVRAQLAQARADGLINVTEYLDELRKCQTKQSAGASVAPADCHDEAALMLAYNKRRVG